MDLIIPLILLGIGQILGFAGFAWILRSWLASRERSITTRINAELEALVKGEPCQSGAILNAVGRNIGQAAGVSAKAAVMSDLGQLSRAENITNREQQLALIGEANPQVGAVIAGMGRRGSGKMLQNPFVQLAMSALMGARGGAGGNHDEATTGGSSVRDRLRKGQ